MPVNNCTTPAAAQALGSVTWNWGNFVQITINFLLTALILFFLVKAYAAGFRRKAPPKKEKDCEACCKSIPIKAMRCPFCTTPVSMPLPAAPSVVTPAAPTSEMYQQQVKRNDSSNTVDAMGGGGGSRDYISQYKMN